MLCVRVQPRCAVASRCAAIARGRTIQALTVEALENVCRQADV